eukprot:3019953-Pleurochrysis_carterae.AAC.1
MKWADTLSVNTRLADGTSRAIQPSRPPRQPSRPPRARETRPIQGPLLAREEVPTPCSSDHLLEVTETGHEFVDSLGLKLRQASLVCRAQYFYVDSCRCSRQNGLPL